MNILVTGSAGFVGKNLVENLKNIRDGKNNTRPGISIEKIYEYDRSNTAEELDTFCSDCDFVFILPVLTVRKIQKSLERVISVSLQRFLIP